MSGRDLRSFLSGHRKLVFDLTTKSRQGELVGALVARENPKKSMTYKNLDYDQVLGQVQQAKEKGKEGLAKIQGIVTKGRTLKEKGLLRIHHEVWMEEKERLRKRQREVEEDVRVWLGGRRGSGEEWWVEFMRGVVAMETELFEERMQFFEDIVQPVLKLRRAVRRGRGKGGGGGGGRKGQLYKQEELKKAAKEEEEGRRRTLCRELDGVRSSLCRELDGVRSSLCRELDGVRSSLCRELDGVRREQKMVGAALEEEKCRLWGELKETGCCRREEEEEENFENGRDLLFELPGALCVEGADPTLREWALNEVHCHDNHYQTLIQELHSHYQPQLSFRHGGWSDLDSKVFSQVLEQYPHSLQKRRPLVIDRLIRQLPHMTRAQIVHHESWYSAISFYRCQRTSLLHSWKQHRAELCTKLVALLEESKQMLEARTLNLEAKKKWRKRAEELSQKVCVWREKKQEEERERADLAATAQAEEEDERRRLERREAEHREKVRSKLAVYYDQKREEREREEEREEERHDEARLCREMEQEEGRERVDYRRRVTERKQREAEEGRERAMAAIREREKRLELLRQKVEVNAVRDPLRLLRDTKASHSHHLTTRTELEAQHPLFPLLGYRDDKVTSDPRFRVAAALKEAGLIHTQYAKKVLLSVPPPSIPRPEQYSSLFK